MGVEKKIEISIQLWLLFKLKLFLFTNEVIVVQTRSLLKEDKIVFLKAAVADPEYLGAKN